MPHGYCELKGIKLQKGDGAFSFKLFSPVHGIWFNELRSSSRQLTPDCVNACVCVCARARQVFPPLSQHGCVLVLPGYRSHAVIHTQIHTFLFPLKPIQSWRLCTQQPADSIKVQRFAKLLHTGSLCSQLSRSVTTSTESGQSSPFYWLQSCWQHVLAALYRQSFLKMFLHVSMQGSLCTCTCMHFCPLISRPGCSVL